VAWLLFASHAYANVSIARGAKQEFTMNTLVRTRSVTAKTGTGSPFGLGVQNATLTLSRNGVACSSPATPVDNAIRWPFGCFYLGHRQGPVRRIA
jgi:hypothetical protein